MEASLTEEKVSLPGWISTSCDVEAGMFWLTVTFCGERQPILYNRLFPAKASPTGGWALAPGSSRYHYHCTTTM
ncbi:hypothetical protein [Bacteroides ovatus]|uniref:hypothetical protein n=1 Tax=Bacteroides ovatus TaxID=28116 RepID=UPI001EE73C8C